MKHNPFQKLNDTYLLNNQNLNFQIIRNKNSLPHSHDFFEICYVIHGEIDETINDKTITLQANHLTIMRPEIDTHAYDLQEEKECIYRDFLVSVDYFRETCRLISRSENFYHSILTAKEAPLFTFTTEEITVLEELFKIETTKYKNQTTTLSLCISILANIIALCIEKQNNQDKASSWIDDLCNLLKTPVNFSRELNSLLNEHFYFNHAYMCKAFKKELGVTMTEFFLTAKLNYAKTLLLTGTYTIESVAQHAGFNNLSYFNRTFKKKYGCTPSAYRKHTS